MVDSSIILAIIKDEDPNCEDKLKEAKRNGQCFITQVGLSEVYNGTFKFITEEVNKMHNECNLIDTTNSRRYNDIMRIFGALDTIFREFTIAEIITESLDKINKLFSIQELRMGSRDRIILGIAESHKNTKFLFIDRAIMRDYKTLIKEGFKIKLEPLN